MQLHATRQAYRKQFDQQYGVQSGDVQGESWLLHNGVAVMQSDVKWKDLPAHSERLCYGSVSDSNKTAESPRKPCVFNDWVCDADDDKQINLASQQSGYDRNRLQWLQTLDLVDDPACADFDVEAEVLRVAQVQHKIMIKHVRRGNFDLAAEIGRTLYNGSYAPSRVTRLLEQVASRPDAADYAQIAAASLQATTQFLAQYGCLQYSRGNHLEGHLACEQACTLLDISGAKHSKHRVLLQQCIGITATYLSTVTTGQSSSDAQAQFRQKAIAALSSAYKTVASAGEFAETVESEDEVSNSPFSMSRDSIEYNYLAALENDRQYSQCLKVMGDMLYNDTTVKPSELALSAVLLAAMVDWGPWAAGAMGRLQRHLQQVGVFQDSDLYAFRIKAHDKLENAQGMAEEDAENEGSALLYEARRISMLSTATINLALRCVQRLDAQTQEDATAAQMAENLIRWVFSTAQQAGTERTPLRSHRWDENRGCRSGISLLTQHFFTAQNGMQQHMLHALSRNLLNPVISRVVLFVELPKASVGEHQLPIQSPSDAQQGQFVQTRVNDQKLRNKLKQNLLATEMAWYCDGGEESTGDFGNGLCGISKHNIEGLLRKVLVISITERLHFATAIDFANVYLPSDPAKGRPISCVAIANSDIYFDQSLDSLTRSWPLDHRNTSAPTVLALAKHTILHSDEPAYNFNTLGLSLRSDSQDAWIFRSPLLPAVTSASSNESVRELANTLLQQTTFPLGAPRCDNRIATVLREHGITPINAALLVRAIEVNSHVRLFSPVTGRALGTDEAQIPERRSRIYSQQGSVHGEGSIVPLSDLRALE